MKLLHPCLRSMDLEHYLMKNRMDTMALTFNQIWEQLKQKKPNIEDSGIVLEFSSENLKVLLRQVYEQGKESGKKPVDNAGFTAFEDVFWSLW